MQNNVDNIKQACKNCSCQLNLEFSFCPCCSQKTDLHRLSMHEVLHDGIHYFTHADKGFFHLIKALAIITGNVAKEYLHGKRKKYFAPLNFFLLVAAIFVFLINLMSSYNKQTDVWQQHPELKDIKNISERNKLYKIYKRQSDAVSFINKYSNVMSMVALPLVTLIYWLFYFKGRYNYTEHLVAGMYMTGFTNLTYILVFVPISLYMVSQYSFYVFIAFVIFQIIYCTIFYYRFMDKPSKTSLLKAFSVSTLAILFWTGLSSFLVGLYIATGFWGLVN